MTKALSRNVLILAATSAGSYVLGLLRDRLLAQQFGASREVDIFNSSFLLPDLIMNLFAAALTTAFIPVFAQVAHKHGDAAAYRSANQVLTVILVAILLMNGLAWITMPTLVHLVAPGFNAVELAQLTSTSRWLLLSPLLFGISTLLGAVLQSKHRFFAYAISPLLYNAGIVIGILALAPSLGIQGVIFGVIIGATLHLTIRLVACIRLSYKPSITAQAWQAPAVRQTLKLIGPRVVGLLGVQASLWTFNAVGSTLAAGNVAIFNFARNFQSLPVSFIGITIATVLFPVLAADFAAEKGEQFLRNAKRAIWAVIGFSIPAMLAMMVLGQFIISTFLGGGSFTSDAIQLTTLTLSVMSLAIPLESLQHILARLYYAKHNTKRPAIITLVGAAVNAVVCVVATRYFGVVGLAIGFVTMTALIDTLLFWPLRYQLMKRSTWKLVSVLTVVISILLLGFGYWQRLVIKDWLTPKVAVPETVSYADISNDETTESGKTLNTNEVAEGIAGDSETKSEDLPAQPGAEIEEKEVVIPAELNLAIPFTSQAPLTNWDALHEEACEEASILMAARFLDGRGIADTSDAENAILTIVGVGETDLDFGVSITAAQTVTLLETIYPDLTGEVIYDFTWDDVKGALAQGYPVLVPAAGRELGNPNFTAPGPVYHMLVIKGYTADYVITNDPGTRKGADYTYTYDTLYNAIHDWNDGQVTTGQKAMIIVKPNPNAE